MRAFSSSDRFGGFQSHTSRVSEIRRRRARCLDLKLPLPRVKCKRWSTSGEERGMFEEFPSKTKNPHRLAPMFLIGIFTDEDSSLNVEAGATARFYSEPTSHGIAECRISLARTTSRVPCVFCSTQQPAEWNSGSSWRSS